MSQDWDLAGLALVGQAVEKRPGQPLAAHWTSGLLLERQGGGHDQAEAFVGPADDLEEQFVSRFCERHVAKLVEDNQVIFLHLGKEALEFAHFEHVGNQRQIARPGHLYPAGLEGTRRQLPHPAQLFGQQRFLDPALAAQPALEILAARLLQPGVELVQAAHLWHRHQEVRPAVTHHPLDHALLLAASRQTKVFLEEVMAL